MKTKYINVPFFIVKINEHNLIKLELLKLIATQNSTKAESSGTAEKISRTDWYVDIGKERDYFKFLFPFLKPYLDNIFEKVNFQEYKISNVWFHQYELDDYHNWHYHHNTFWSAVYYIELPSTEQATQFDEIFDIDLTEENITEGTLIVFPSIIRHRSPPNNKSRKTIVSFNIV